MASIVVNPNGLNNTDNNSPSYFDISVTGADNAPRPILNGQYDGYCLSPFDPIDGQTYPAEVADGAQLSAYTNAAADLSGVDADDVAAVNYLLFQYYVNPAFPFSGVEPGVIQFAIWQELDFLPTDTEANDFLTVPINWDLLTNGLANTQANRDAFLADVAGVRGEIEAARSGPGLDVPPGFQTALIDPTESPPDAPDLQPLIVVLSSLGDRVWADENANGQQDPGELGVADVVVELKDEAGDVVADTVTDSNGEYIFTGLPPGTYSVVFTPPAGFAFTALNVGDDALDSDADPAMGGMTQEVTLASGEFNDTLDAGLIETASLGDKVFFDTDADGIQDAGEAGVEGVTVTLTGGGANGVIGDADDTTDITTTDADGEYLFEDLNPGEEYQVTFSDLPLGFEFTAADQGGDDTLDSDADPVNGTTPIVTLAQGEENRTLDAGIKEIPPELGSLSGRYFCDENDNDVDDGQAVDPGVAGVVVTLFDASANVVATTTTDALGEYRFDGLVAGTYSVQFTDPNNVLAGKELVTPNVGGDDTVDSDAIGDTTTSVIENIVVEPGLETADNDAGAEKTAGLGDFVFEDLDGDGTQDAGEPGVEGVTVDLKDGNGDIVATTQTDANGAYSFTGLIPGTYSVAFTPPAGFVFTDLNVGDDALDSDADPAMGGMTQEVTLTSGEFNDTLDAGLVRPASLGDFVFLDDDADGIQDAGEVGIQGVEVTLTGGGANGIIGDADDTTDTTTTAADGSYAFTGLNPGEEYQVSFDQPAGLEVSPVDQGGDDTVDSDGLTAPIVTLASGENNPTIDQGFFELASLGDFVFEDLDGDGTQDAGEPGVEGVTVDLKDGNGDIVATTQTDANGAYSFTGLIPGTYSVVFTPPAGFVFTDLNVGDDALDSDADPAMGGMTQEVTLTSGEFNDTLDAGLVEIPPELGSLSGRYFCDENDNDVDDGQAVDPGVADVVVTLFDATANVVATTTTDALGEYRFDGLVAGTYSVQFTDPNNVLAGKELVTPNVGGDDTVDSDAIGDTTTSVIENIVVEPGLETADNDAGAEKTAGLGDFVFEDLDGDGTQDAGEPGVEGVTVDLKDGNGDIVATTQTDANGAYSFTGLIPGTYSVAFTPPAGFVFTDLNVGDDALDSDADPAMGGMTQEVTLTSGEFNDTLDAGLVRPASLGDFVFLDDDADGIQDAGEVGIQGVEVTLTGGGANGIIGDADDTTDTTTTAADGSYAFTGLNPGEEYQVSFDQPAGLEVSPVDQGGDDTVDSDGLTAPIVTLASGENNPTIDQGFFELASLGDFVFEDLDGDGTQDAGEPGVEGVTVDLKDGNGDIVATTQTDANGAYSFTGLIPGTYSVVFTPPAGFVFTDLNVGDDALDSDADPAMGGMTAEVTLTSGEFNDTLDAGLVEQLGSLSGRYFLDDGPDPARDCDGLDNDFVSDPSETAIAGVRVDLVLKGVGIVATTTTDANGEYEFAGLESGDYRVIFSTVDGTEFTDPNIGDDDTIDSDVARILNSGRGATTFLSLESGENLTDIDAGVCTLASLGDKVFFDTNRDGIQDAGEAGVEGVTVTLTGGGDDGVIGTADDTTDTTTTDANGEYLFDDLNPGEEYQVTFSDLPAGLGFTEADQGGDDALDSDADPANGQAPIVTLAPGEFNDTLDAGLVEQLGSLSGRYFLDDGPDPARDCDGLDNDFVSDPSETAIAGVRVDLVLKGVGIVATTTTDANGEYEFAGLESGDYRVIFSTVDGTEFTDPNIGDDDTIDSDVARILNSGRGATTFLSLESGENLTDIDAGVCTLASLGDKVFFDTNRDGIQDAGEAGVEGVTVTLTGGGDDGVIGTADDTTDTTTTDANGEYLFEDLNPGEEYQVTFSDLPAGLGFTEADQGGDDALDSDADPANGQAPIVTLAPGEFNDTLDAGLVEQLGSLSGRYFLDDGPDPARDCDGLDNDFVSDPSETAIAGVRVDLVLKGVGIVATTTTDANGEYEFAGLESGDYRVIFSTVDGTEFTDPNIGDDDTIDSDVARILNSGRGATTFLSLESGENLTDIDAGVCTLASLGDKVFFDTNRDGIQDAGEAGVEGVTVTLTGGGDDGVIGTADDTTDTTTTDANGEYLFDDLNPGEEYQVTFSDLPAGLGFTEADQGGDDALDSDADPANGQAPIVTLAPGEFNDTLDAGLVEQLGSLSGRYFLDDGPDPARDCDGLDNDFVSDPSETAIAGVRVDLVLKGVGIVATTTTDANGEYEFAGLESGDYRVIFSTVDGTEFTDPNIGDDDTIDSDVARILNSGRGATTFLSLESGENLTDIDAGVCTLASLGDKVFFDTNRDGIQDAGEAGVEGVTVTLTGGGDDGVIGTADDTTDTTTTDANGEYLFEDLNPGEEYQVTFSDLPAGLGFTEADQGGDDALDSDADPANGQTPIVTLAPGEENRTVDAGLVDQLGSLTGRYFCDENDNDVDDGQAVDPGVAGVVVTLFDASANVVATTTTDALGEYRFDGLVAGTYSVQFTDPNNVLAGKELVTPNVGGDDTVDSDAIGDTTTSVIENIVVEPGLETADNDAGAEKTAGLGDFVFEDLDGDGTQDAGEPGVADVTVDLKDDDGNVIATTTTDANGAYSFTGLIPGTYSVAFTPPAGFVFTDLNVGDDTLDSDADPAMGGMTAEVTLTSGEFNDTLDAGLVRPASLGDTVFEDANGNGLQDPGEDGVENVTVQLFACDENDEPILTGAPNNDGVLAETTTDANGNYSFDGLEPGKYAVKFITPTGFSLTTADVGANDALDSDAGLGGFTGCYELESGETNNTVDAGLVEGASLGDFVFLDDDADGIQDAGEVGIQGVEVTLTGGGANGIIGDADDTTDTTTTAADGSYAFTGLNPGEEYQVSFDQPAGLEVSPVDQGGDDTVDSDGLTAPIVTLASGENNPTIDQGFYELASLGDFVFEDLDGDGTQDAGEPGVADVTVDLKDGNGDIVATTTTDANGAYSFTGLIPGTYSVAFTPPAGFVFTDLNVGDDALDSDADPAMGGMTQEVTLTSGEFNDTLDAGLLRPGIDIETCIEVTQTSQGEEVHLDFEGFPAGEIITDQYAGQGVTISASGGSGNAMIFDTANPTGGDPDLATTDQGKVLIISEDGDSADPDDASGGGTLVFDFSDPDGVAIDEINLLDTEETGEIRLFDTEGALVGTIPIPAIADGAQQTVAIGAVGLGRMEVQLGGSGAITGIKYSDTDVTTICEDADLCEDGPEFEVGETVVIKYEVTNTTGVDLKDVVVVDDNRTPDDPTDDFEPVFVGGDDGDGILEQGETWIYESSSQAVEGVNTASATVTGTSVNEDGTGPIQVTDLDPHCYTGVINPASLGDFVFEDTNGNGQQDPGENGVSNVTVELYTCVNDQPDQLVATTTTDANGNYSFDGLNPGEYIVRFVTPAGFELTTANVGDDSTDSDAGAGGFTGCYTLESGETNNTVDAGLIPDASIQLEKFVDIAGVSGGDCPTGPIGAGNTGGAAGGVDLGGLTQYLFVFANGSEDANWQSSSKGYVGDVVVNGVIADERTSGDFAYAGTISTNDSNLGAWQDIVDNNPGQASAATGESALVTQLQSDLTSAFAQIDGLSATSGYTSVSALSLDNWNTQNGVDETFVVNVTSGFSISETIDITGDAGDVFILRWDEDADASNGYQGQVKFQSGGAINPLGALAASNFIHVAGDIDASGGGSAPSGLADELAEIDAIDGGAGVGSGGFFTGYWLTTGDPHDADTASLSNAIFVGGWYTLSDKFSLTSGTSGVHVCANPETLGGSSAFDENDLGVETLTAQVGDDLVFTYKVTNTSNVELTNLHLVDDDATPGAPGDDFNPAPVLVDGFNFGDADQDNVFDPGEMWYFRETGLTAEEGERTNVAVVTATGPGQQQVTDTDDATVVVVGESSIDIEKYVAPEGYAPFVPMVCETYGKPLEMTFRYSTGTTVNADQDSDKASVLVDNGADDDGQSWVLVTDKEDAFDTGAKVFFAGLVAEGDAFTAGVNASADKFGSETFVHFFDDANGASGPGTGLLQSLNYHTSCSQPINLGDVIGNATLVGYVGEDGAATPINSFGEDADVGPGPEADFGSLLTFTYEVTNTGETTLGAVDVTDNRLDDVTLIDNGDGDTLLAPGETWLYEATETALVGQVSNTGTVTANPFVDGGLLNVDVTDSDDANYVVVGGPQIDVEKFVRVAGYEPFVPMVCETYGDPVEMTFTYKVDDDNDFVSNTQEGRAAILSSQTLADDDGTSYILVTDSDKPFDTGANVFFAGDVGEGGEFVAAGNFGSSTYIHFFDSQADFDSQPDVDMANATGLLQSLTYHTSCSKPINLGDETGYAQLVGYVGVNGAADPVNEYGEDADTGPGPQAVIGEEVEFFYTITNPGATPLDEIKLTDDRIPDLTFLGGDDGDGLLEAGEEWLYTGTEIATEGSNTNVAIATGTAVDANGVDLGLPDVSDSDAAVYEGVEELFPEFAVCDEFGDPEVLEFSYAPSQSFDTSQDPDKAGFIFDSGLVDDDNTAFIVVNDNDNAFDTGSVFFAGEVLVGEEFFASAANAGSSFGSNTRIHIFDEETDYLAQDTGGLIQSMEYHTSCSQPIFIGDQIASVTLVGYQGEDGSWGI